MTVRRRISSAAYLYVLRAGRLTARREKAIIKPYRIIGNEKESTRCRTAKRIPDGASGMRRARRKMALEPRTEPQRMR